MRNGIPFDVAFSADDVTRAGWSIIFSEHEGGKFNFGTMDWEDQK